MCLFYNSSISGYNVCQILKFLCCAALGHFINLRRLQNRALAISAASQLENVASDVFDYAENTCCTFKPGIKSVYCNG